MATTGPLSGADQWRLSARGPQASPQVYAGSGGLSVLVLDGRAFAGQDGASARIEKLPGLSDRHHRDGADGACLHPGAEIRGRDGDPGRIEEADILGLARSVAGHQGNQEIVDLISIGNQARALRDVLPASSGSSDRPFSAFRLCASCCFRIWSVRRRTSFNSSDFGSFDFIPFGPRIHLNLLHDALPVSSREGGGSLVPHLFASDGQAASWRSACLDTAWFAGARGRTAVLGDADASAFPGAVLRFLRTSKVPSRLCSASHGNPRRSFQHLLGAAATST